MESDEDSRDIDDNSAEINATEIINKTDLEDVILEVNSLNLDNRTDKANSASAILGSWFSTPQPQQLKTLLKMYGHGGWDADSAKFSKSIMQLDFDRNFHYSSKVDVTNDLDNIYSDQHEICSESGLGHRNDKVHESVATYG